MFKGKGFRVKEKLNAMEWKRLWIIYRLEAYSLGDLGGMMAESTG